MLCCIAQCCTLAVGAPPHQCRQWCMHVARSHAASAAPPPLSLVHRVPPLLFRQVPDTVYMWPMVAFATAILLNLLSMGFERRPVKRQLCFLVGGWVGAGGCCRRRADGGSAGGDGGMQISACVAPGSVRQRSWRATEGGGQPPPRLPRCDSSVVTCCRRRAPQAVYISGVAFVYEFLAWKRTAPIYITASGRPLSLLRCARQLGWGAGGRRPGGHAHAGGQR